jgi:hypothetical protein
MPTLRRPRVGPEELSVRAEQRRFRAFLWLVALLSAALLTIVQLVYQDGVSTHHPLISTNGDSVAATVLTALLGTTFGSSLVGILLDEYQRRFSNKVDEYDQFLHGEGILAVYESSQEPRLIAAMEHAISDARSQIIGIGLGLSVLMNRILLMRIAERLSVEKSLRVRVLVGSPQNDGVMNRVREEESWHKSHGITYDPTWPEYFPKEIRSILELHAGKPNQERVQVVQLKSCPTIGLLKIDRRLFVFLYGSPNMRGGSQSVWIELDASEKDGYFNQFLDKYIEFFGAEADEIAIDTGQSSTGTAGGVAS